jgi:hypothetical protein
MPVTLKALTEFAFEAALFHAPPTKVPGCILAPSILMHVDPKLSTVF